MDIHNTLIQLLAKQNPTIVEVGCNDGFDSSIFLHNFKDVNLTCFEVDQRAIKKFKSTIHDERCVLIEKAVGDFDGCSDFHVCEGQNPGLPNYGDWDQSSSIKKPKDHLQRHPWCLFNKTVVVPIIKLDTWFSTQNVKHIDLIWADVQGAERELINGAMKTLCEHTTYFYTEYSDTETYEGALNIQHIQSLLPSFELLGKFENNILLHNKQF